MSEDNTATIISPINVGFSVYNGDGMEPLTVTFTDTTVYDKPIDKWEWNFGDGGVSSEQHPKYTYVKKGIYTASLTVTSGEYTGTATATIYCRVGKTDLSNPIQKWDDEVDGVHYHHAIYKTTNEMGGDAYFQIDEVYTPEVAPEVTPVTNPLDNLADSEVKAQLTEMTITLNAIKEALGITSTTVEVN